RKFNRQVAKNTKEGRDCKNCRAKETFLIFFFAFLGFLACPLGGSISFTLPTSILLRLRVGRNGSF
ncbi:MAG: hypothetical protein V3V20_07405, partial [Algisphaera sp.]